MAITIIKDLCIYLLTWNVAFKDPTGVNMNDMLTLNGKSSCPGGRLPDLYVLGFQEVQSQPMLDVINTHLGQRNYVPIGTEVLRNIVIQVWSAGQHVSHLNSVEAAYTKTGFGGLWGNKGAVSVRMSLYGKAASFVVAHLAAHDENLQKRINDYQSIVKKLRYESFGYPTILDHDVVIWSGDLNFRLNGQDSAESIADTIQSGNFQKLFDRDQLSAVRSTGKAFTQFSELQPMFAPTFKYIIGTSIYDLKRRPAWCDRILFRVSKKASNSGTQLSQLSYRSHPQYTLSDHKPVTAEFLLSL